MTDHWTRDSIRAELERVDDHLETSLTAYLRGGGAMVLREFRDGTPDIDLVLSSADDLDSLAGAFSSAGYERMMRTDAEDTGSMRRLTDNQGREVDLFDTQVGSGLVLSEGIERRSEPVLELDRLEVRLLSPEDIYLRKVVHQGRPEDKPDVDALARTGLDRETIHEELAAQRELVDEELPTMVFFGGFGGDSGA